ncbi:MAG: ComF family protein [Enhydrobacter sp.]|nr:MAG: ComF family protein [Enhydrobacter sp.]
MIQACARAGRRLVDVVLPPLCLRCGEIVAEPGALCAACWPGLAFVAPPHCARCGVPFAEDLGPDAWCAECLNRPPAFRHARAALVYDDDSRRLILPFKHGDRTDLAKACGRWMAQAGAQLAAAADLVVPVPLHWRRLLWRRYNQAGLLAGIVARQTGRRFAPDLLRRRRWTGSQAGLDSRERRRNVRLAFDIHPDWAGELEDKTVLLVDDVLTTGATVEACARVLRRGGARHVDVLTLARVVRAAV